MTRTPIAARLVAALAFAACTVHRAAAQEPMPPHETFTLHSAALNETRRINVYIPPGFNTARSAALPVLYMPDGGVEEDFPHVSSTVHAGIAAGEMRPMMVVGIENTERRRDMTGPTTVEEDRRIAPRVGGSAAFRAFIANELIPEIGRRYRVSGERAIIGESLAGLFVVETFLAQPDLFDTYVALSPSLWWNGEALVRTAGDRLRAEPCTTATLFLSSADAEENIAPSVVRLTEQLRAAAPAGVRWRYVPRPDLQHSTIYRSSAPGVLRDLFPAKRPAR
ncbi:MAG TPA: alpha/beta hydrolase-fold protein [Longimicrobium sp.]